MRPFVHWFVAQPPSTSDPENQADRIFFGSLNDMMTIQDPGGDSSEDGSGDEDVGEDEEDV